MKSIDLSISDFGKNQYLISQKIRLHPFLGKIIKKIFGYTIISNYARFMATKRAFQKINFNKLDHILDLGCGFGEYASLVAEKFPSINVVGIDIDLTCINSVNKIKTAVKLSNLTLHQGMIQSLANCYKKFDLIYSIDVFEHIHENQMPFSACYTRLSDRGLLFIKMPSQFQKTIFPDKYFSKHNEWLKHEHPGQVYNLEQLKKRLVCEGFQVVYSEYTDGLFARLAWEIDYFARSCHSIVQLMLLPLNKLLVHIDQITPKKYRNAMTVIARKRCNEN